MNGYNFTERSRVVLMLARTEAERLNHEYVGTEHLLLGLIREGEGIANAVLENLNVNAAEVRSTIENIVQKGQNPRPDIGLPFTSRAKKAIELAMEYARDLNHNYVGTEHLLLGLLREQKGIAAQVLLHAGLTTEAAVKEVRRLLGERPESEIVKQSIVHVAIVVRDYDEAIEWYTTKLGFKLIEDTYQPEQDKRWVLVAPPASHGAQLLLAKATKPEQERAIGNQTGGRVFLFLRTDDVWRDYNRMVSVGIKFIREPKVESYGTVSVFEDLYGNLWDLVQLTESTSA
jgi:catechol 2,3-dioxygenase-like lactoylglutathione lyase family enzyme